MQVILTEQQLNEVIRFEEAKNLLKSLVSKYINLETLEMSREDYEEIKLKIKWCSRILGVTTVAVMLVNAPRIIKNAFQEEVGARVETVYPDMHEGDPGYVESGTEPGEDPYLTKDTAKFANTEELKVQQLQNYMDSIARRNNFDPKEMQVSARDFIDACKNYNFDPIFAIAQAQLESHFGLNGKRCKETNSIFSVGLYDDGRNMVTFPSQKESIDHYLRTMTNRYLTDLDGNKKELQDLLPNGCFVDKYGKRYASYENYERDLRCIYNTVARCCPALKEA